MKKKVYLLQIGSSFATPWFLPYSMGCIAAYLKRDTEISEHYVIPDIITAREPIDKVLNRFDSPFMAAFSCSVWNIEYNKALAERLKKIYPRIIIVFGGPSIEKDGSLLDRCPYVDFLMYNEGEESTAALLKALENGEDLKSVPNLCFRSGEEKVTTDFYVPEDISDYPSPYTDGIFDGIMAEFPDIEYHVTIETNRGCPYSCAYCEWSCTKKVRLFPIEKVKKEIEWAARHKISYSYCADANFGMFDRDVEIAEFVVEQKKKYGYPGVFKPCYAKESNENVFKAGYILNKNQIDKSVTLAYQSLDKTALENIGRKNLTLESFAEIDAKFTAAGVPTYTELILGLPGETFESFCKGICTLLEKGQNNSMTVYDCQVYPNTLISSKDYRERFGIKTSVIPQLGIHFTPELNGVQEYIEIITETATMPKKDWVKACMFAVVLQTFHHLGLLRYFAIYLHNEKGVSYYDFYNRLFSYIYKESDGFVNGFFESLSRRKYDTETADWTYQRDVFGSTGWYFEEGAFLEMVYHFDEFRSDMMPFLKSFDVEPELLEGLLDYQYSLIRLLNKDEATVCSDWNFYSYFEKGAELKKIKSVLHVKSEKIFDNWADYAREVIWFGKRYSATLLVNPRDRIDYSEETE